MIQNGSTCPSIALRALVTGAACCVFVVVLGCGSLPLEGPDGPITDVACLDEWSISHFTSNMVLGSQLDEEGGLVLAVSGAILWETLIEPSISSESTQNQVCDVMLALLGWTAGSR
jgi:hypothetical protein